MTLTSDADNDRDQEDVPLTEAPSEPAQRAPYPILREDHILGASKLIKTHTPWRVYNALMGLEKEKPFDPTGRLDLKFRRWVRQDAETNYGLVAKRFDGDTSFEGPFHAVPPEVITDPGSMLGSAGDLLMIQTPAKDAYELVWKAGYELAVPASVAAKAQIRMAVTGAKRTLVWVISDNGRVSEYEYVLRDDAFIESLRQGCRDVLKAADKGEEPAPDDTDIEDYVLMRAGTKGVRSIQVGSDEHKALLDYEAHAKTLRQIGIEQKGVKILQDKAKSVLVNSMSDGSFLKMPDDTVVGMKKVTIEPKMQNGYSYNRLDIKKSSAED